MRGKYEIGAHLIRNQIVAKGLSIYVSDFFAFAPHVAGCCVLVVLEESHASGAATITIDPSISGSRIAKVFQALSRFFAGNQFQSINFETGVMTVAKTEQDGKVSLVPSDCGNLRDDGVVEIQYDVPYK